MQTFHADANNNTGDSDDITEGASIEETPRREHRDYLDGVRGAAALFVIGHHMWLQAKLPFTLYGHFAVDLFIVLSGFCLALPAAANEGRIPGGALRYYLRRGLRILPPYYLCLAVSLVMVHLWQLENVTTPALMTHLLLIHDAYPKYDLAINSPLWTIAVEWRIYLVFPLLVLLNRYWGAVPTVAICALVSEIIYRLLQDTWVNVGLHGVSPHYLTLFATGMLGAGIVQGREQVLVRGWAAWLWWPLVIGLTYLMVSAGTLPQSAARVWDYAIGFWAAALLVLISIPAGKIIRSIFSFRPLVWCGAFGYSLYLLHMPLIRVLEPTLQNTGWIPADLDPMTRFYYLAGMALPAILVICGAFFLMCELPFREWSRQLWRIAPRPGEEFEEIEENAAPIRAAQEPAI